MTPQRANQLIDALLERTTADQATVSIEAWTTSNVRFARNMVTTSGETVDHEISVTVTFGSRSGTASTNQLDDAALTQVVRTAETLAQLSPEDPEYVPPMGPQAYNPVEGWLEPSGPEIMAAHVFNVIQRAEADQLVAAGFAQQSHGWSFLANQAGLCARHRWSDATLSATLRTPDGRGSGWANRAAGRAADLDAAGLADDAARKALQSAGAEAMEPGPVRAVLEPACVASLVRSMTWSMGARSADEGRSYFSKPGGGNRIGERLLAPSFSLRSDPADARAPQAPWASGSGQPRGATPWFDRGVLRTLPRGRYWAQHTDTEAVPWPSNLLMDGGSGSVEDLIRGTRRGVLITSLWYIRSVDPRSLLLTGLTRDGVFRIENGEVVAPLTNFRWNDSPIAVFRGIEAMSEAVRVSPRGSTSTNIVVPAIRTKEFTLSSVSDAV